LNEVIAEERSSWSDADEIPRICDTLSGAGTGSKRLIQGIWDLYHALPSRDKIVSIQKGRCFEYIKDLLSTFKYKPQIPEWLLVFDWRVCICGVALQY
jgi:hypothetical protein